MKRADIKPTDLAAAPGRIESGERYEDVARSFGVGATALRAALRRAGLRYRFGRRSKYGIFQPPKKLPRRIWETEPSSDKPEIKINEIAVEWLNRKLIQDV